MRIRTLPQDAQSVQIGRSVKNVNFKPLDTINLTKTDPREIFHRVSWVVFLSMFSSPEENGEPIQLGVSSAEETPDPIHVDDEIAKLGGVSMIVDFLNWQLSDNWLSWVVFK